MSSLRLVVLGDPHITPSELPLWDMAIEDINALKPDAVLVLGDLTGGVETGTPAGMKLALEVLNRLEAPWRTIIGNHDLQAKVFDTDEQAVAGFLERIGRSTPWFTEDFGPLSVIGLSNTQWRQNTFQHNELVLNDEQLAWWEGELKRLADRPVLVLGHAPPIGSGLLTLTELHCQVGNAFMNQNHLPSRVQKMIHENPNILFWFSGHNHMGQHYRDAITLRQGVHYIHTGVVSRRQGRDGQRHTRVLDIHEDAILVRTFDHARRDLDKSLEHREKFGLSAFMEYRRAMLGRRMVPREPDTMRQGPGHARSSTAVRFAFLSDVHLVKPISGNQQRLIDWCLRQIKQHAADRVVLGGDMTHHADPDQSAEFLDQLGLVELPIDYLPGNNEGEQMASSFPRRSNVRAITGCQPGGAGWPGNVFLLQTTHTTDAAESVRQLAGQWPESGNVLILAHFPPSSIGDAVKELAAAHPDQNILWICGHKHTLEMTVEGNLHVVTSGGLDPVKVRGSLPTLLMVDWDGQEPAISTLQPPEALLHPLKFQQHPVGLAYRDSAGPMVETALEYGIASLQFHHSFSHGQVTPGDARAIGEFRQRFTQGFLSLHLPGFADDPAGPVCAEMEPALQWAREAGLDDLTLHLPDVPAGRLFDAQRNWLDTPWVHACQQAYLHLAECAMKMGTQLSLENLYNKRTVDPMEEKLSSRPWHLLKFVEWLHEALAEKGYPPEQAGRVGIIFDVGHAFHDVRVSKVHGLADWIREISPYLQLAHIHQVGLSPDGKKRNHQPITSRLGPMINYVGVLAALEEHARRPVPLLIEVRDKEGAITSWGALAPR